MKTKETTPTLSDPRSTEKILASIKELAAKYIAGQNISILKIKNATKYAYTDTEYASAVDLAIDAGIITREYELWDPVNKEIYHITPEEQAEAVKNGFAINPETGLETSLSNILEYYFRAKK